MEGESTRQLKVAKELQRHLAEIIRAKGMAAFDGALVTVSGVKISCCQGIFEHLPLFKSSASDEDYRGVFKISSWRAWKDSGKAIEDSS